VIDHEREVAVALPPRDLVDPDVEEILKPAGVELCGAHPRDDSPDRRPVDP